MKPYLEDRKEKKRKRRGLAWSLFFHALLILLMLWPFIHADKEPATDKVYVQFATASAGSSSEGAPSSSQSKKSGEKTDDPTPRSKPAEALPSQSIKEVPMKVDEVTQKEVLSPTAVESPEPSVPTSRNAAPLESRQTSQISSQVEQAPLGDQEIKGLKDAMASMNTGSEGSGSEGESGEASSSASGTGSGQGKGQTGQGQSDRGDGDVQGARPGFINGDGILTRKIVKRANINALIKEEGKLVVKVCINRQGQVIYSEFDEENSTIQRTELKQTAVRTATNWLFAKDPSAPKRECGRVSFIVDLPD